MSRLLHHLIKDSAQTEPDASALTSGKTHLSYGELQHHLETTAAGLQNLGLKPGDRVAVYLPKQPETVLALFATAWTGGIFVPVNPLLKPAQVAHILHDCGATVLVTSVDRGKLLADVLPACTSLQHLIITDGTAQPETFPSLTVTDWQALQSDNTPIHTDITDNSIAAILYTSGSTGRPKGVVLSHRNLVLGAESVAQYLGTRTSDRLLAVLPLSFDYGLNQLITAFHAGASVVLMNYLLPRDIVRTVSRERITTLAGVPSLWMQLASLAWPEDITTHLRTLTNSGGHLPVPVIKSLQQRLPASRLFLMYGLTEAFRSSYLPPEELAARPASMGKAIPHAELAVVRPDGTACAPDEPGELVHAGPLVAQGYWNNPAATERHFRPPPAAMPVHNTSEKVLWSGDTVTMDADGYLYFVGREDDMIKTSGYRVSPTEVEEVLHASGLVNEATVFGVPHPTLGQAIVALITPATGTQVDDATAVQQVLAHCRAALPAFMLPTHMEQREQLPKTPNGKIDRQRLKQAFHAHFTEAPLTETP
ncbi:MAG TPA: acyl-CoA ligase (AMP-forming), exosortase A system-associated [Gammaproteobacteria bacterium]|nr:acyl-CoA ligase (AMP-forming), exosortase A system-associated [Gammaproteobacteria bacterium]